MIFNNRVRYCLLFLMVLLSAVLLQKIENNIDIHDIRRQEKLNQASNHRIDHERYLASAIDVSQTTVNGLSDFQVNQIKTISVIPRDSSGNALGSGCDIYIQISNQ